MIDTQAQAATLARLAFEAYADGGNQSRFVAIEHWARWLGDYFASRGVRVLPEAGREPSGEALDELATAVGALTNDDVIELTESWTDRDGCFYGGTPEWRATLVGRLKERRAALAWTSPPPEKKP